LRHARGSRRDANRSKSRDIRLCGRGRRRLCAPCDGRYFPVQRHSGVSSAQTCSSFCPASATRIYNGNTINHAVASDGKRYSELATAFVYRERIIPGCTCNGRDAFGLTISTTPSRNAIRRGRRWPKMKPDANCGPPAPGERHRRHRCTKRNSRIS
jgi:hypothetical protein